MGHRLHAHLARIHILIGGLAVLAVAPLRAQPIPFVLEHFELEARVDYARRTVNGTATLRVQGGVRDARTLPLLLNRLMAVTQVTDAQGQRLPFTQEVVVFADDPSYQVNAIAVELPRTLDGSTAVTVRVTYGGVLVGYAETGALYIRDSVDSAFTILREDALAFPVLGRAAGDAMRSLERRPFTFRVAVVVPRGQVVATGGVFRDTVPEGPALRWTYASDVGVPFLNITIAPYRVVGHAAGTIFAFPQDTVGAQEVRDALGRAHAMLEDSFGALPSPPRLTVMEIPEDFGSQADAVAGIIQSARAFRERSARRELYHELTHLWNVPDAERPSARWNEGLASFLEYRMAEALDGSSYVTGMDSVARRTAARCAADAACLRTPLAQYGAERLTDYSYSVGRAFFFALFRTMGATAFDASYRDYLRRYRGASGSLVQLRAIFVQRDPRAERVFREWVESTTWLQRLRAGELLSAMIEGYSR